jgi:hypothetical protein
MVRTLNPLPRGGCFDDAEFLALLKEIAAKQTALPDAPTPQSKRLSRLLDSPQEMLAIGEKAWASWLNKRCVRGVRAKTAQFSAKISTDWRRSAGGVGCSKNKPRLGLNPSGAFTSAELAQSVP